MTDDPRDREREPGAEPWSLLARALEPVPPPPELKARLLAAIEGPERWAPFIKEIAGLFGVTPAAMRAALARIPDPTAWQPAILPGSFFTTTPELAQARTVITRLPPSTRIPVHRHGERELTYVLDGELIENGRQQRGAGELLDMAPGTEHELESGDRGECLVVFSVRPS